MSRTRTKTRTTTTLTKRDSYPPFRRMTLIDVFFQVVRFVEGLDVRRQRSSRLRFPGQPHRRRRRRVGRRLRRRWRGTGGAAGCATASAIWRPERRTLIAADVVVVVVAAAVNRVRVGSTLRGQHRGKGIVLLLMLILLLMLLFLGVLMWGGGRIRGRVVVAWMVGLTLWRDGRGGRKIMVE